MGTSRRISAAASVREQIKRYILQHRLAPGDLMPTELELCAELGVSRSSVREAMNQLDALDIVDVQHGRGTFVGEISLAPLVDSVSFRCLVDRREADAALREIIDVRRALELGQAAVVVAALHGKHDDDLHDLVDTMLARSGGGRRFPDQDRAFHIGLQQHASENRLAHNLIGAFWDIHTFVIGEVGAPDSKDIEETARAHRDMLEAAERGDEPAYVAAVHAHYEPLLRVLGRAAADRD